MIYEPNKWIFDWERRSTLFMPYVVANVWVKKRKDKFYQFSGLMVSKNNVASAYYNTQEVLSASEQLVRRFTLDKKLLLSWRKNVDLVSIAMKQWCQRLGERNLSQLANIELAELFLEYFKLYTDLINNVVIIRTFNQTAVSLLEKLLGAKNFKQNISEVLALLSTPKEASFVRRNNSEISKIANAEEQGEDISLLIDQYLKEWQWVSVGYDDEPALVAKDVRNEVEKIRKQEATLNSDVVAERLQVLKIVKDDKHILNLSEAFATATYFKDYLREVCNYSHFCSRPLLIEIGRRLGITFRCVKMLTPIEIKKGLLSKEGIDQSEINQRKKYYVIDAKLTGVKVITGRKAQLIAKKELRFSVEKTEQISGMVACTGVASGKVIIIKNANDYKQEKGFVMVSPMTTPEMVSYMKNSVAIITDEGGLTSHAAMISREFRIPCIVGTKNATKILKDGDMVEVDANKGTVRKI